MQGLRVEGGLQRRHLVQEHAERPDVRLEVVGLAPDDFGAQVVRRAHNCAGLRLGV